MSLFLSMCLSVFFFLFFNDTATTEFYTLSLHDALPICFSLLRTASSGLYLVYNEFDERMSGLGPAQREFVIKYNYLFDVFQ